MSLRCLLQVNLHNWDPTFFAIVHTFRLALGVSGQPILDSTFLIMINVHYFLLMLKYYFTKMTYLHAYSFLLLKNSKNLFQILLQNYLTKIYLDLCHRNLIIKFMKFLIFFEMILFWLGYYQIRYWIKGHFHFLKILKILILIQVLGCLKHLKSYLLQLIEYII